MCTSTKYLGWGGGRGSKDESHDSLVMTHGSLPWVVASHTICLSTSAPLHSNPATPTPIATTPSSSLVMCMYVLSIIIIIIIIVDMYLILSASVRHEFIGYSDPAVEGTSVYFSCHLELVLTGPNISTCVRNGEWEPDPREVECRGNNFTLSSHKIIYKIIG